MNVRTATYLLNQHHPRTLAGIKREKQEKTPIKVPVGNLEQMVAEDDGVSVRGKVMVTVTH